MDTAKALDLRAANDLAGLGARVRRPGPRARAARRRRPDDRRHRRRDQLFAVITDEAAGRKGYIGHPSLLPVATILDPGLTVGLPPAATAATGIDAMTHSLESLLSANPNPFAEAMALGVIRTVGTWLRRAVADGSDLEARSQMLMASHLAGRRAGERDRRRARPRAGPLDRDARQGRPRDGARRRPAGGPALLPRHARSRAGAGRDRARRRVDAPRSESTAAAVAIGAIDKLLRDVDQRPTLRRLGLADDAAIDQLVTDTLDDAAIRNSPRLPTAAEARAILEAVAG